MSYASKKFVWLLRGLKAKNLMGNGKLIWLMERENIYKIRAYLKMTSELYNVNPGLINPMVV